MTTRQWKLASGFSVTLLIAATCYIAHLKQVGLDLEFSMQQTARQAQSGLVSVREVCGQVVRALRAPDVGRPTPMSLVLVARTCVGTSSSAAETQELPTLMLRVDGEGFARRIEARMKANRLPYRGYGPLEVMEIPPEID